MSDSPRNIRLIALDTYRQVVLHNPWFQLSAIGLVLIVSLVAPFGDLPLGSSAPKLLYDWGNGFVLGLSGLVMVVLLSFLLQQDLGSGFLGCMLTRPVRRYEYLLGKSCGVAASIGLVILVADICLALMVDWKLKEVYSVYGVSGEEINWTVYFQLLVFQILYLGLLASFVLLINSFSKSFLFSVLASLLLWLICLLTGGASLALNEWSGFLGSILGLVLPHFEVLIISDTLWYMGSLSVSDLLSRVGIGFVYILCLVSLSAYLFNRREL